MKTFTRALAGAAVAAALALTSFSAVSAELESLTPSGKTVKVQVPDNPKRVAVIDMAVLDMLDYWKLTDRIVAMPKTTPVSFLKHAFDNKNVANVGTLKEVDM